MGNLGISYTETTTQINVASWYYAAIAVESVTKVQADRDLLRLYAGKMGYALDLQVDDDLAALIDDDASSQNVGTLAIPLLYEDVLRGSQYLDDANAPDSGRVIAASPAQVTQWMTLDQFIHADYSAVHGGQGAPAGQAYTRSWLNMPVYRSTNVEGSNAAGHDNAMFHREAHACVIQMKPTARNHYDIDYLVDKVVLEILYGVKVMRSDHSCWMKGA